jgi:beta-carotene/zeaxanthin 4-ketolase
MIAPQPPAHARDHRQTVIGLTLAGILMASWLTLHVVGVFWWPLHGAWLLVAPAVVLILTWLYVGLFIVAHDCMHGSLAPGRPRLNRTIGRLALIAYAWFDYDRVIQKHHAHHRHAGTTGDPDFDEHPPHGFWRWYGRFFTEYFGWRQFALISLQVALYILVLGADLFNVLLFWALPGLLSSLQLFAFGTYLPHRPRRDAFIDRHNARSNDYPVWVSLLTCFHFGYHHEHHLHPGDPWWRLPARRRARDGSTIPPATAVP